MLLKNALIFEAAFEMQSKEAFDVMYRAESKTASRNKIVFVA